MQPCKTGDQPYSDASPNGECSLLDPLCNVKTGILIEGMDALLNELLHL